MRAATQDIKQFKHDIASPIEALKSLTSHSQFSSTELKILNLSIDRVEGLVKSLEKEEDLNLINIYKATKEVISEKSSNKIKIIFDPKSKEAMCKIQEHEFKRVLSNIINNSLSAIDEQGFIKIKAQVLNREVKLSIIDNGHGIECQYLKCITNLGWSHRKADGTGLGLFHAKKSIEKWRGKLRVNSVFNLGTKVTLQLPLGPSRLSIAA